MIPDLCPLSYFENVHAVLSLTGRSDIWLYLHKVESELKMTPSCTWCMYVPEMHTLLLLFSSDLHLQDTCVNFSLDLTSH